MRNGGLRFANLPYGLRRTSCVKSTVGLLFGMLDARFGVDRMKRAELIKWSAVASKPRVKLFPEKNTPLRMLSIPAVNVLERHLLLYGADHPETAREVVSVCRDLFGIEPSETEYEMPARYWTLSNYDPEKMRLHNLSVDYENQFETGDDLTDDETVEVLKGFGLDFLDDRRQPLLCTKLFSRVVEFAAKGIKGKLPDRGAVQLAKFEDSLKQQRDAYLTNKGKRGLS